MNFLPPRTKMLPDTLAQRLQVLREACGYSLSGLAHKSQLAVSEIEDIEAGLVGFLATITRHRLCKALKVKPDVLQAVEKLPPLLEAEVFPLSNEQTLALLETVANHPGQQHLCPRCKQPLLVQRFERLDMNAQPIHAIKLRCPKCWFKADHG